MLVSAGMEQATTYLHCHPGWPLTGDRRSPVASLAASEGIPVGLDLLRGDLYRILDKLVRARAKSHGDLVAQFERSWKEFKEATANQTGD